MLTTTVALTSSTSQLTSPNQISPTFSFTFQETNRIAVPKSSTTQKSKLSTGFPPLRVSASSQSAPASAEASKVMVLPSEMKAWIYGEYRGVDVLKFDTKVVVPELLEDQEREIGEKIKIGVCVMEKKVKCGSDVFSAPIGRFSKSCKHLANLSACS
ncbi:hypothetical protein ACFX11_040894 [Malus domestica]